MVILKSGRLPHGVRLAEHNLLMASSLSEDAIYHRKSSPVTRTSGEIDHYLVSLSPAIGQHAISLVGR